jgi:hypothetical protein
VVPEAIEGSLMLASHALALVGVPMRRVIRVVQDQRDARYNLLRGYFHGADDDTVDEIAQRAAGDLHAALGAKSIGKPLGHLALHALGVRVVSLRRAQRASSLPARMTPNSRTATRWCCRAFPRTCPSPSRSCCGHNEPCLQNRPTACDPPSMHNLSVNQYLRNHIRTVPDWPAPGVQFRDITPLLQDAKVFRVLIDAFVHRYMDADAAPDVVAGLDARGFILGAVVAYELNVGFVPIRKKGKLPFTTVEETYELEYGSATVELHTDAVKNGTACC